MNETEILKILSEVSALIKDSHIVYTSGRHGSAYVNKDALYPHTDQTSKLCKEMAERFADSNIDVVAGPTVGGVILSQWVAHFLSELSGRNVRAVFAEEDENKNRFFKRGYDKLIPKKNVLVVEDIVTTGGSVKKVVDAVKKLGGNIVGCTLLCNRGGISKEDLGVPRLEALVNINLESWKENECPLCEKNIPINTGVGKGREYLAQKN
jgi:orotate phosphoribosyltransferase